MLGDAVIEDLPMGFTAVATDLVHRREVWFQRGSLKKAIRASIAIPMVFTPLREGDRILADGGILNPLPVAAAASYPADIVAAVNVNAFSSNNYPAPPPRRERDKQDAFRAGLAQFLKNVGWKDASEKPKSEMGLFDTLQRSFEIMQASVSNYKIAGYPPDIVIEIPADACNAFDFHKAYDMIEVGRKAARQVLRRKGMLD
jgi:NTE family protein